nr:MAG TPA: hypothetical protein [Caudoviricetes sp.]
MQIFCVKVLLNVITLVIYYVLLYIFALLIINNCIWHV